MHYFLFRVLVGWNRSFLWPYRRVILLLNLAQSLTTIANAFGSQILKVLLLVFSILYNVLNEFTLTLYSLLLNSVREYFGIFTEQNSIHYVWKNHNGKNWVEVIFGMHMCSYILLYSC